ncbi:MULTISPECIES: FxSxx-COOH system tetratricopeptide repeat protein [Streptomyces]|uniref:Tetratricopeptide repeat protein n=1 Tax=Streptomyces morookaense TaxID=1970 RepID=A0A7Y7B7I1_STRMO|nr:MULTISPECIES: FxSxx-COOH system tetratricopeptide repeat protein [Streptomyces]MCC2277642.1 tetratricopeptide repeat protein [Streptomyces sp. ET3-23]NVK80465.1 tetratricopeptide repeat protein [Streptomyces morookaense]GHF13786.1 ATP-binding protein [Streptomyces morookaense]
MSTQRQGSGSGSAQAGESFVVVFAGFHRPWGTWISHRLESHGHSVVLHRWDPRREVPLEDYLGDLLLATGRILLVLDDWFFALGPRREGEWSEALRGIVARNADRFAAVNLTNRPLLPATVVLKPVELWGVGAQEAERRLLGRLDLPAGPARRSLPPGPGTRYPNDPPAVWGEVPRRNARFTGRDDLLNSLQEQLMDADQGTAVCALVGMPGIGKTQLAAEYAHRFSSDYDVVWWVNSDTRGTQRERLGELAPELGLIAGSEPGERIRAVHEALRRGDPYPRWLLIFDGWDDPEGAEDLLPDGAGHVLITSRNRRWAEAGATPVEIPGFQRHESTGYLMRRAPRITAEEADAVSAELEDIPLALVQAAAWLGESDMDVADYLRMVRSGELAGFADQPGFDSVPRSSLTSWSILINRLREAQPHAVELLSLCTAFAPGRIPIGLVRRLPPSQLPEGLAWLAGDLPSWTRALDTLVSYSVISARDTRTALAGEPGPEQESVHMHRLVHDIVSRLTAPDEQREYRRVVRRTLAAADPGNPQDSRLWPRYAELLPHLEPSGAFASNDAGVQTTVLNLLRYCFRSGEFRLGAELAEKIRMQWSEMFPPEHPRMLDLTTQQTNILRSHGGFRAAYELDRAVLERLRCTPGAEPTALMTATSSLAADQRYLGQYAEALQMQREVLDTALRLLGPDDYLTLLAQHNLGLGLRLLGRYAEAYDIDLETLRKREALLRTRHAATLVSGLSCARDLRLMGRYADALARQELVVRMHIQVLGPQHPQTLRARHNLVLCERRAGTLQDIGGAMAGLLEQMEQVHGRRHYATTTFLVDYGNYLREHGELDHARDLILEGDHAFRELLGPAHPISTGMQSNVGLILQAAGERADALTLFEQAYAGLAAALGPDHPAVLGCALNAAAGRNFNGRLDSAEELSRDTLRRARHALGQDHPFTLSCEVALAMDLRGLRQHEEAGKVEEDALQRLTRTLGAQHPHTLSARQRVRPYWDFEPYLG